MIIKWAITNKCNLNCIHCYNALIRDESSLPAEVIERIIDEFAQNNVTRIQFLGGEPLLSENISLALRKCYDKEIKTEINTNGTIVIPEVIDEICKSVVEKIVFSIDGYTSEANDSIRGDGSFGKAITNLSNLISSIKRRGAKTKVCINSVLGRKGLESPDDLFMFLRNFPEIDDVTISIPEIVGNALTQPDGYWPDYEDFFGYFYEASSKLPLYKGKATINFGVPPLAKKMVSDFFDLGSYKRIHEYCMGSSSVFYLDADGILYPCNLTQGIEWFRARLNLDYLNMNCNVKTKPFGEIYSSAEYLEFFQHVRFRDISIEKRVRNTVCSSCSEFKWCQVACPLEDDIIAASNLCKIATEHFRQEVSEA